MRAAVFYGREDVRIEDVTEGDLQPDEVRIKLSACGLCGSDVHTYNLGRPTPTAPFVLGHEFAGKVVERGPDVDSVDVGDVVAVDPIVPCGHCPTCEAGYTGICDNYALHGYSPEHDGGLAEYANVRSNLVFRLPPGVSGREGALVEPLTVGYHAVARASTTRHDTAAIFGAGPIGIAVFLNLRALGVETIVVVEPSAVRRRAIEGLGAQVVIDPVGQDVLSELKAHTEGRGPDVSFDAAGAPAAFADALAASAARGRVVVIAKHMKPAVGFSPEDIKRKELSVLGSHGHSGDEMQAVIDAMGAGKFPTDSWVEDIALEDTIAKGLLPYRAQDVTKILVTMNG
jgi:(R,R)-butanediol dehydrogenase / meso-butanediol dehydrogenase / diacetyl reductase